jgi:hypothetical protein
MPFVDYKFKLIEGRAKKVKNWNSCIKEGNCLTVRTYIIERKHLAVGKMRHYELLMTIFLVGTPYV